MPSVKKTPNLNFKHPAVWLATWFGCGLLKPAPGTWGTLGALPVGILLVMFTGLPGLLIGTVIISVIGYWASGVFEKMSGEKDSSMIVIDEAAGIWLTLLAAPMTPLGAGLAFVFFRVFDVLKPWPVSYVDKKMSGPLSVMGDDILAGIYAALCLIGLKYAGFDY